MNRWGYTGRALNILVLLFVSLIVINLTSCFYSFSGASVPPHLQTIAIPVVDDRSGRGEQGLREGLTNRLIQKFTDDNTLDVAEKVNADALLECSIVAFSDEAAVVSTDETLKLKRITVTVRTVYKDLVQKKIISDKNYSNYGDYDPANLDARRAAIETAIEKISEDILLGTVSNW